MTQVTTFWVDNWYSEIARCTGSTLTCYLDGGCDNQRRYSFNGVPKICVYACGYCIWKRGVCCFKNSECVYEWCFQQIEEKSKRRKTKIVINHLSTFINHAVNSTTRPKYFLSIIHVGLSVYIRSHQLVDIHIKQQQNVAGEAISPHSYSMCLIMHHDGNAIANRVIAERVEKLPLAASAA